MKKLFQNTISIVLLVCYLTGFCGLNLLKHSCFVCQESDYHLIYDLKVDGDEMQGCEVDSPLISSKEESSHAHYNNVSCCSLELIYLKNHPKTILQQAEKSLSPSTLDLFIGVDLYLHNFFDVGVEQRADYRYKIIDPFKIAQDFLCCFRC